MNTSTVQAPVDAGLTTAELRYSPEGLMRRYARGRVSHVAQRQVLTLLGGLALWAVDGPQTAAVALVLVAVGEGLDCLYLRTVPARLDRGVPLKRILFVSTVTAAVQAVTIAMCIGLSWFGIAGQTSPLFAIGFLAGAAINAGVVLPYHPSAAIARLAIYCVAAGLFFTQGALYAPSNRANLPLNAAGALILTYLVTVFLRFVVEGFRRHSKNILALTEQSRALVKLNAALNENEQENQRLAAAVRHANDSVVVYGSDGRIAWVNHAFTRITGYSEDEAIGRYPGDLLNDPQTDPIVIGDIALATQQGVPFRGEILNRTKSGKLIWIETSQVPVSETGCEGRPDMFVAIERDITDAKRQEQELAMAKRAAEMGARTKAEFLATMSHEIRTPMNAVIGMADLLCDTPLTDDQQVYADTIRTSSQALLNIINDVLEISKLDAGKVQLAQDPFDLRHCLDGVAQLMRGQAEAKGLFLNVDLSSDLPAWVMGDDGRIRQVLINLLGNAVKFTEHGGVTVTVRADPKENASTFRIAVKDTGIGIPDSKLDRIFDSFAQADAATTRRFGGTGLGLSISRRLVQAMGGTLTVSSTEGEGSCFCLDLPLALAKDADIPRKTTADTSANVARLAGMDVLVAEDNKVNRLLLQKFLDGLPIRLRFAEDGAEAVEMVLDDPPDLVLMDMSMPRLSGVDATRVIRAAPGLQPAIVALTANAFATDRAACLTAGMDAFLTKPIRRAELVACLMQYRPDVAVAAEA